MKQISFAQTEHQDKKKLTRRERFLAQTDALPPSYYPNLAAKRGRPPIGLEHMLRVYFLQQWYALVDEVLEDAIYIQLGHAQLRRYRSGHRERARCHDAAAIPSFAGEAHPDPADLREDQGQPSRAGPVYARGHDRRGGPLHQEQSQAARLRDETDPKGQPMVLRHEGPHRRQCSDRADAYRRCHFGQRGGCHQAEHLVRDDDKRVHADAGYMSKRLGGEKDAEGSRCCIAAKRGGIKKIEESPMKELLLKIERTKASIRAKIEHPFHVIKNFFGYRKTRYKELAKNQAQLFSLFALANLVLSTRREGRADGVSAS